jgi:hypothetical protein
MKSIHIAQRSFRTNQGKGRYGTLRELVESSLLKPDLISGEYHGYRFDIRPHADKYSAVATPLKYAQSGPSGTGSMSFFIDESGVIRGDEKKGAEATRSDEPFLKQ